EADERFSLVEHPMSARALAAPLHRHAREDEYSYVITGRMGALLGDEVVFAEAGDLVFKPRGQWHAFWNAGDEPARLLEIISPAGFDLYFKEIAPLLPPNREQPDYERLAEVMTRYEVEMDFDSIATLAGKHCLRLDGWPGLFIWRGRCGLPGRRPASTPDEQSGLEVNEGRSGEETVTASLARPHGTCPS